MTLRDWIMGWVVWRRVKKTVPLAEARARRASTIVRERRHHRPVRDLYRAQMADTTKQLRLELGR